MDNVYARQLARTTFTLVCPDYLYPSMPGLDRYPSMTGWNVVVTPVIRPYDRCHSAGFNHSCRGDEVVRPDTGHKALMRGVNISSSAEQVCLRISGQCCKI